MKKLIIMRHAKSDWTNENLRDFDRPLNERGNQAAPLIGEEFVKRGWIPDKIFCSKAVRAKQTAKHVAKKLNIPLREISYDLRFYYGFVDDYFDFIRLMDDNIDFALIIGHNPNIEGIVYHLAKNKEICGKMPTAAAAYFELNIENWSDLLPNTNDLKFVLKPKEL